MIGDAEGAVDDLGDALAGPHLPAEAVSLRPALQQGGELGHLCGRELGSGTWGRMPPQPLHTLLAPTFEPLADGSRCRRRPSRQSSWEVCVLMTQGYHHFSSLRKGQ